MAVLKKKSNATLKEEAKENVSITKISGKKEKLVKKGSIPDNSTKCSVAPVPNKDSSLGITTVGLSKGATINMGDYQSFRVDCWLTANVNPNDPDSVMETLNSLSDIIAEVIEEETIKVTEEDDD